MAYGIRYVCKKPLVVVVTTYRAWVRGTLILPYTACKINAYDISTCVYTFTV